MELILFVFIFFYPLLMAIYWMTGAIIFFNRRENRNSKRPELKSYPKVAILVPCHNEATCIEDVVTQLSNNDYPSFEIIAINDGSSDKTGEILKSLTEKIDCLKVVNLTKNYGKAMALKSGVMACTSEFVMCIDADALLDKDALFWMVKHFQDGPRVGAVTGNPRVINKTSLLSRIQIGEFSAIVGMVKRTQRNIGRVFTVSGVNTCFRLTALHDAGYWSPETVTEDIDISWKLQLRYWDIRYEPRAITWILVPETLSSLWKQRLRWAQGGFEAATKFAKDIWKWKNRRMWIIGIEYWVSLLWCYALAFTLLCWAATHILPANMWPESLQIQTLIPKWPGVVLAIVCLLQFTVGLVIDSIYEKRGLFRYLFWAIWYPAIYWLLNAATTVVAVPKRLLKFKATRYASWKSPGRNIRYRPLKIRKVNKQRAEQRLLFWKLVPKSKRLAELIIMFISWSLWAYLITPLLSLIVWGAGAYLFMDRIVEPLSDGIPQSVVGFTFIIFTMWILLGVWITWNRNRYGKKNRRNRGMPEVTIDDIGTAMKTRNGEVSQLRNNRETFLHYDDTDSPVIEPAATVFEPTKIYRKNNVINL